jgi:hypothetical protein
MICAFQPHPIAPSLLGEGLVVSEKEIVSDAQKNHTEGQPIASDQVLTPVQSPHLRNVLLDRDVRSRGSDARSRGRNNHRSGSDCGTDVLGRSDFQKVSRDGGSDWSRGDRSNYSAQRSNDHTINLSRVDSGSELNGLDEDALQLDRRSIIGDCARTRSRTMRREAGQSGEIDRGGHGVEDRLGDGSSGGGKGDILTAH